MAISETNGNKIYWDESTHTYRYCDDNQSIRDVTKKCPHCQQFPTKDGHDACIANLPDVKFACCGHYSEMGFPYAAFNDGRVLYFYSTDHLKKYFGIKD